MDVWGHLYCKLLVQRERKRDGKGAPRKIVILNKNSDKLGPMYSMVVLDILQWFSIQVPFRVI